MPDPPESSRELIHEVRGLACGVARARARRSARFPPADQWDMDNLLVRARLGRKEDYLAVLRAALDVAAAAQVIIDEAIERARWRRASYAELAAAQGISRQAARQREERRTARRQIRLTGGPCDGQERAVVRTSRETRFGVWAGPWEERLGRIREEFPPVTVEYHAKYGSPDVFEFHHYENSESGVVLKVWDRRSRIHQLADYWHTEPDVVRTILRSLAAEGDNTG